MRPLVRVRVAGGPARFHVLGAGLAEKLDQRTPVFLLLDGHAQHFREQAQRAGERVSAGLGHRAVPPLQWHVDSPGRVVVQHTAVKRDVVRDEGVAGVVQHGPDIFIHF